MKPLTHLSSRQRVARDLERQIQRIRFEPPPEWLLERCMPPAPGPLGSGTANEMERTGNLKATLLTRAIPLGLAASIGITTLTLLLGWPKTPKASAEVLRAALAALETPPAIHIVTETDDGPGTPLRERWEIWSAKGLGYRMEDSCSLEVYDARNAMRYVRDKTTNEAQMTDLDDSALMLEFLGRGELKRSLRMLAQAAEDVEVSVADEPIQGLEKSTRRLSLTDANGRPVLADIDLTMERILRIEFWTAPSVDRAPVRVVSAFEYFAADDLSPSLFEALALGDAHIRRTSSDRAALQQCLTNLRDLATAVLDYAEHHGGTMPVDVELVRQWEGFRETMLFCPTKVSNGTVQYVNYLKELGGRRCAELSWDTPLFECGRHAQGTLRSFVGGHAMLVPEAQE